MDKLLRLVDKALAVLAQKPYTLTETVVWAAVICESDAKWDLEECRKNLLASHLTSQPSPDYVTDRDGAWWTRSVNAGQYVGVAAAFKNAGLVFTEAVVHQAQLRTYLDQLAIRITTAGKLVFADPAVTYRLAVGCDRKTLASQQITEIRRDKTHWAAARVNLLSQLNPI